jgi:hypothetical protein
MKPSTESNGLLRIGSRADATGAESANVRDMLNNAGHSATCTHTHTHTALQCSATSHPSKMKTPKSVGKSISGGGIKMACFIYTSTVCTVHAADIR